MQEAVWVAVTRVPITIKMAFMIGSAKCSLDRVLRDDVRRRSRHLLGVGFSHMGDDVIGDSVDLRVGVADPGDELGQGC